MGGCFSFYQAVHALTADGVESYDGYVVGIAVLGVALLSEGASLLRALHQVRGQGGVDGLRDPALRTVVAEDGTAVLGVTLAIAGMALHMVTGQVIWEASASFAIGALLVYVAYWLGRDAREQLIGVAADPEPSRKIRSCRRRSPRSTAWRPCSPCNSAWTPPLWRPGSTSSPASTARRWRRSPSVSRAPSPTSSPRPTRSSST